MVLDIAASDDAQYLLGNDMSPHSYNTVANGSNRREKQNRREQNHAIRGGAWNPSFAGPAPFALPIQIASVPPGNNRDDDNHNE